jgi:uncharacterized protein
MEKIKYKHIGVLIVLLKFSLIAFFVWKVAPTFKFSALTENYDFSLFILAGFVAQMIDGALGMAYGVSCTTLLLSFGIPQAVATASVHTAEVFTTGASGLSHLYMKNVDKRLFFRLAIPGIIGACFGAYLVSDVLDGDKIKPFISAYLLVIGAIILYKGFRTKPKENVEVKRMGLLGFSGGFLDAIGGGGWGPIVTSNIINQGKSPKEVIGTVNTAEFFITFCSTGVFLFFVGIKGFLVILGLGIGGVLAAPIGAFLSKKADAKFLMKMVGLLLIIVSFYSIYKSVAKLGLL